MTRYEEGTFEEMVKSIADLSKDSFRDHALTVLADTLEINAWLARKPGTNVYSFKVILAPGLVVVTGDIGEVILRHSDANSLAWVRGSVQSLQYVLEKVRHPEDYYYVGDAVAWLKEWREERRLELEGDGVRGEKLRSHDEATTEAIDAIQRSKDYGGCPDQVVWEQCHELGIDEGPDCWGHGPHVLWCIEGLKAFVRLVDAAPVLANS